MSACALLLNLRVAPLLLWHAARVFLFLYFFSHSARGDFWRASSRQRSRAFSFIEHFICWLPIAALKFPSAFVSFDIYSTPNHTHKNKTGCCFIAASRFEWNSFERQRTSAAAVNPFQGETETKLSAHSANTNSKVRPSHFGFYLDLLFCYLISDSMLCCCWVAVQVQIQSFRQKRQVLH